jgi:hypothetical protein
MKTTILPIVFLLSTTILRAETGVGGHNSTTHKSASSVHSSSAVRNILSTQLPARLQSSIKTKYSTYWITDLYKCTTEGKVCYYITLENADQKLKLNTSHGSNWQIARVVSKDVASR